MFPRFKSKKELGINLGRNDFSEWPSATYTFCPKCGLDNFELLYEDSSDIYIRCKICNSLWNIKSARGRYYGQLRLV